jgi:hypothetical protein
MGRGLSDLQKGILGIAYTVNVHTQGEPMVKTRRDRAVRVSFWEECDYLSGLGVYLLYGIALSPGIKRSAFVMHQGGYFAYSPAARRAQAASSRATTRLLARGLLAMCRQHYILTERGIEIGRINGRPIPMIEDVLRFFGFPRPRLNYTDRKAYVERLNAALGEIKVITTA